MSLEEVEQDDIPRDYNLGGKGMNENYTNMYEDEMEINLIDLMFYLLRQWRTLLVVLIIGAIAGCGIFGLKTFQAARAEQELKAEEEEEIDYSDYKVEPEVRSNMEIACEYRVLYDKQLEYNENSLIMKMDPSQVYYGELKYYLSAGENTRLLSELYTDIFSNNDILEDIKRAGKLTCDIQYIREIIGSSASRERGDSIEIHNIINEMLENSELGYNNSVLYFTINYSDEKACEDMLQVIQKEVEKMTKDFQKQYDEFTFEELNNSVRLNINSDYLNRQRSAVDVLNTYLGNYTRIEGTFEEEDLEYYRAEYLSRADLLEEEEEEEEELSIGDRVKSLIKWMIIAIFLAGVCWGGYYCMKYLFDKRIKTSDELQDVYRLRILGKLEKPHEEKNKIDQKLEDLRRKMNTPPDSLSHVKSMILSLNKKNIIFSGNLEEESLNIVKGLWEKESDYKYMRFVHQDDKALQVAKDAEGVIIVAEVNGTISREIRRELEVCRIQGIPVLGTVVVE